MIIGICGSAGSGKDTAADEIIRNNKSYKKIKLADRLKDTVSVLFDWDRNMLEGVTPESRKWRELVDIDLYKNTGIKLSPRKALQIVGSDLIRDRLKSDFWAVIVKNEIIKHNLKNVVIADCRYPDEIEMIQSLGGKIIWINKETDWSSIAHRFAYYFNKRGILSKIKTKFYKHKLNKLGIHPGEYMWMTKINTMDVCIKHVKNDADTFRSNVMEWFNLQPKAKKKIKKENKLAKHF